MPGTWIDACLRRAAEIARASDLVLDPGEDVVVVRVRSDGVYREIERRPAADAGPGVARLKALAGVPAYVVDEAQDGRIAGQVFGFSGDLRAAFLPTVRGPRAALRLPAVGALPQPTALGLPSAVVAGLRNVAHRPDGLLLVCGPTGSGKTTTIHSLLADLVETRPDRQVVAIEDPVERRLPGVVQVEVRPQLGFDFAQALRAVLRQDPDVIVIGEIRDRETAQAAVRAALTGHLVITTLHCGRAGEALLRLREMGIERGLLLPVLAGVLAQRLVRLRHHPCAGQGCADCAGGYAGRRVVADWIMPDHAQRLAWADGVTPQLVADLERQAAELVASGATDVYESARVIGENGPQACANKARAETEDTSEHAAVSSKSAIAVQR